MSIEFLENIIHMLIMNRVPAEMIDHLFDPNFIDDVTIQLIFEILKLDFDDSMESEAHSLRQYNANAYDYASAKQSDHRILQYVQHYRDQQASRMKETYGYAPDELRSKKMSSIKERLEGHAISPMQHMEMQNIQNIQLLKKLTGKQICSSKKVSNKQFIEMYDEYEALIDSYRKGMTSDKAIVNNTIAFFNLEWKYALEWAYKIAHSVALGELPECRIEQARVLCIPLNSQSFFGAAGENRLYIARNRYFDYLCDPTATEKWLMEKWIQYGVTFSVTANLKQLYKAKLMAHMQNIPVSEKAEFIRKHYDIWGNIQHKEWTGKKIKIARQFFDSIFMDISLPKIK